MTKTTIKIKTWLVNGFKIKAENEEQAMRKYTDMYVGIYGHYYSKLN